MIKYKGKEITSQEFAKIVGVSPSTITKYQQLGLDVDAIKARIKEFRKRGSAKWTYQGHTYSCKQWAAILMIDRRSLTNKAQYLRRKYGLDYTQSNTQTLHRRYEEIQREEKLKLGTKPPSHHHDTTRDRQESSQ